MISTSRSRMLRLPAMCLSVRLWGMLSIVATFAALAVVFVGPAVADEIQDQIQAARQTHEQATAAAKETLSKACVARVKEAAGTEDLDLVKTLISDKELFEADEALPTHASLAEEVAKYIDARKSSAAAVATAYQTAIQSYAAKFQLEDVKKLEMDLKQFTEEESGAITKLTKPKLDERGSERRGDDRGNSLTKSRMTDFYAEYEKMLTDLRDRPTMAKQDEWHRNYLKRIDERIKGQSWEVHCKIEDIQAAATGQPGANGKFTINHAAPDEYPGPDKCWNFRRSVLVFLTQEQAVSVKPGDYLVYTFTPRIVSTAPTPGWGVPPTAVDTECFSATSEVGSRSFAHALHMTNVKMKFQKSADASDASKAAAKGQKAK